MAARFFRSSSRYFCSNGFRRVAGAAWNHLRSAAEDDLMDHDAIAYCAREADDSITLDDVRAGTAKIQDSMARAVVEDERAERS